MPAFHKNETLNLSIHYLSFYRFHYYVWSKVSKLVEYQKENAFIKILFSLIKFVQTFFYAFYLVVITFLQIVSQFTEHHTFRWERKKRKTNRETYRQNRLYRSHQSRFPRSSYPIPHSSIDHPILLGFRVNMSLGCSHYLVEQVIIQCTENRSNLSNI